LNISFSRGYTSFDQSGLRKVKDKDDCREVPLEDTKATDTCPRPGLRDGYLWMSMRSGRNLSALDSDFEVVVRIMDLQNINAKVMINLRAEHISLVEQTHVKSSGLFH
jgi:hypothetical protein